MLTDFITANRELIIDRARQRVRNRANSNSTDAKLEHGIPLFLTQLASALEPMAGKEPPRLDRADRATNDTRRISNSAALHGHDLLRNGFTIAQVVHGYGDICQIVTELAGELNAPISTDDFRVFNRCLDDAIAGSVTAYGLERERNLTYEGTERLGVLAHELRNLLNTAVLSFDVIKRGTVAINGSTGAVHTRALSALKMLVDRSLAEVRLEAGKPTLERIRVAEFLEEVEMSSALEAQGRGVHLAVGSVDADLTIRADRQLLASALSNLLQNAFKFTRHDGTVSLEVHSTVDSVRLSVSDECGGLPVGKVDALFQPFKRASSDHSGLGLGLSIALRATRANAGALEVRDLPGKGCIFTISLPRATQG